MMIGFLFSKKEGTYIKISELFGIQSNKKRTLLKRVVPIGLLITAVLSFVIVVITLYGQHTGTFLLSLTPEAANKGIIMSSTSDFKQGVTRISIAPLDEVSDMIEEQLKIEEALKQDGQYYDQEFNNYIAYTFYIKNLSDEAVDLKYTIRIEDDSKGLDRAVKVKLVEDDLINAPIYHPSVYKQTASSVLSVGHVRRFQEERVVKFSLFVWFDGELTNESMLGGAIKLSILFSIETAESEA